MRRDRSRGTHSRGELSGNADYSNQNISSDKSYHKRGSESIHILPFETAHTAQTAQTEMPIGTSLEISAINASAHAFQASECAAIINEAQNERSNHLPKEAGSFIRRIGSTTYRVGIYFSCTSKETARDKIARLVRSEAERQAAGQ